MTAILVAFDSRYGIGRDGKIPWSCPDDMRRFKERTMGNIVIMGRRTAESIPLGLPGRFPIVLSNTENPYGVRNPYCLDGLYSVSKSLETAITYCQDFLPALSIFIIGGEQVYREALEKDLVDTVYATKIYGLHGCDKFFPVDLIPKGWRHDIFTHAAPTTFEYHTWSRYG